MLRCGIMKIPDKLQNDEVAILRQGGQEAINFFLKKAQRLHETGVADALRDWVKLAAPALPNEERGEVMVLLMYGFLYMSYRGPGELALHKCTKEKPLTRRG